MALCSSIRSIINAAILFLIITNFHSQNCVRASPAPLFFDAIANFFNPGRQPSGTSSTYGAPNSGSGGIGLPRLPFLRMPSFNFPSFGGIGNNPSGAAASKPSRRPSYKSPGGRSPGRPPIPIVPNIFKTSPTRRPSYRPQPVPSRPRPGYGPPKRPTPRPTKRPTYRPTYRPNPRPSRPTRRPTQPHCNACSGPWNTVAGPNIDNVQPTYFPSFPNNGQTASYNTNDNNNNGFRQPQYGQSPSSTNNNKIKGPLPTYASTSNNNNFQNKFPKNMGTIKSVSSLDSLDSYGSPQAPIINSNSQDNYGSSNVKDNNIVEGSGNEKLPGRPIVNISG